MKKALIYIVLAIGIVACGTKETKVASIETNVKTEVPESVESKISYNDPSVFVGSDFGTFINLLYKQGKFDEMVKWTSSSTISKFGKGEVIEFYKNKMNFGYKLTKLHSKTVSGDTIILNYQTDKFSPDRTVRIPVIVENDSCKLILSNLEKFPG